MTIILEIVDSKTFEKNIFAFADNFCGIARDYLDAKAGKKLSLKAHVKTMGKTANKTLTWTSSNEKYATVSKKGVVKIKIK